MSGNVLVVDKGNNRVQKFSPSGDYLSQFGVTGAGDGQFTGPTSIAIDPKGNIWVLDSANRRVQKFNPNGEYLSKFGTGGTGNGQLSTAEGIAIDSKGNIWIADTYNSRVQKFNEKGEFLKVVGSKGTGVGQLIEPTGIAIGPNGNAWVADWSNNKVVVFNEAGEYVRQFGTSGTGNGQFTRPDVVAVNGKGDVFVGDQNNSRVQQFNQSGEYVTKFGSAGSGAGQFSLTYPMGIATDPKGNVWVSDNKNNRVQKWAIPGYNPAYASAFGTAGTGSGQFNRPSDIARDAQGNFWVVDRANERLQMFSATGAYLYKFGAFGEANGKLSVPSSVAIDAQGYLWVLDAGNRRVQKFSPAGNFQMKFGSAGSGNGQFGAAAEGIAIDPKGNIWVADTNNGRVQKFNANGEFLKVVGTSGTGVGQLSRPAGVDIGPSGNVWVTDRNNNKVVIFNEAGEYVRQFGSLGSGPGQFSHPVGITIDGKGNVWIADEGNSRIQEFNQASEYLGQFGSAGTAAGQLSFTYPMGLANDGKGSIWIADSKNNRVQKWTESTARTKVGTEISIDGKLVDSSESWCLSESCPVTRQWTLDSSTYSVGLHAATVKALDGFGNSTTKNLVFNVARDTTKPTLQLSGELAEAPEGWVQQESYGLSAVASDPAGYGVTALTFRIDGQTVNSTSQSCLDGGCGSSMSKSLNMATYAGGAHAAEVTATDGAGNTSTKKWTINVDPDGHVSTAEAEATLDAVEETSPVNPIGPPVEEEGIEGTAPAIGIEEAGDELEAIGTQIPTAISQEAESGITLQVPVAGDLAPICPEEGVPSAPCVTQEKYDAEIQAASDNKYPGFNPLQIVPVETSMEGVVEGKIVGDDAAIYPNVQQHVDSIVRPLFDGVLYFKSIRDETAPETFEWEVELQPGQEIKLIDDQHAMIYYAGGHPYGAIVAEPAHDAIGSSVPTALSVSQGNVVTLTVRHHAPSPAGGSFIYPVLAGSGWQGGFQSVIVELPKTEQPEEEEGEEGAAEWDDAAPGTGLKIVTFGPPVAQLSLAGSTLEPKSAARNEKAFKFTYCHPHRIPHDILNGKFPVSGWGVRGREEKSLPQIVSECHREDFHGVYWGVSVYGRFHYIYQHWVWLNDDQWGCHKWGEEQPSMEHCKKGFTEVPTGPANAVHGPISAFGQFRFKSGKGQWTPEASAACLTEGGKLYPNPRRAFEEAYERPMIWEVEYIFAGAENCDWTQ